MRHDERLAVAVGLHERHGEHLGLLIRLAVCFRMRLVDTAHDHHRVVPLHADGLLVVDNVGDRVGATGPALHVDAVDEPDEE